jgi:L-amino acid N-acyltransferase YncA
MNIRPATLADIADMHSIYEHAVLHGTGSYELDPPDEAELARRFTTNTGNGFPWILAEEGGVILAYALCGSRGQGQGHWQGTASEAHRALHRVGLSPDGGGDWRR